MMKNDTLKNGTSCIGLYGSAPPGGGGSMQLNQTFLMSMFCNNYLKKPVHFNSKKLKRIVLEKGIM